MNPYYRDYADFLTDTFGHKVQKLPVDIGATCPNRDGTVGRGGCIYCDNRAFVALCAEASLGVGAQLERGRRFFSRRGFARRYMAYFQGHTPTHGRRDRLLDAIAQALDCDDVDGIAIGTRPDAMPDSLLQALADIASRRAPVVIEYGAESSHDITLGRIGRGHTWQCVADTVRRTADAGLKVGLHLINGLPGETRAMMLSTADAVSALPVDTVKFHQLQIVNGTALHSLYLAGKADIATFTPPDYAVLCADLLGRLRRDIAVDRWLSVSPPGMVAAPRWGIRPETFTALLHDELRRRAEQGDSRSC